MLIRECVKAFIYFMEDDIDKLDLDVRIVALLA
jgi:hypothetical protein